MAEVLEYSDMFYTNFDPKLNNQFIMDIAGIPSYLIKTAKKPSLSFETITLDHINLKRKMKGKADWGTVDITLYDPIVGSGAQAVMEWVRTSHESLSGRDGYSSMYKKDLDFYQLGPVGDKVDQWKLKGAWISSADFGNMDWAGSEAVEISVTLTYDFAVLEY